MDASRTVVAAPMSFAGAAGRTTNLLWHGRPTAVKVVAVVAVPSILFAWWLAIVAWYALFGLLLAPYRLLRRGSRKRKREARMHEETLRAIRASQQRPPGQG
jgi:membrane protein implicated in regulation of membrane protease activity